MPSQVSEGQHNQESQERKGRVVSYKKLLTDMKYSSTDNNNLNEAGKRFGTGFQNIDTVTVQKK